MRLVLMHYAAVVEGIAGMIGIILFRKLLHHYLPVKIDFYEKFALVWGGYGYFAKYV